MASVLLIADASKVIREALGRLLGSIGDVGTVIYASSLDQAFEQTATHKPNILVMDPRFAAGNAIASMGHLKQLAPQMQLVVITNDANAVSREYFLAAGADLYFDKAIELDLLVDAVRSRANPKHSNGSVTTDAPQGNTYE